MNSCPYASRDRKLDSSRGRYRFYVLEEMRALSPARTSVNEQEASAVRSALASPRRAALKSRASEPVRMSYIRKINNRTVFCEIDDGEVLLFSSS